MRIVKTDLIPDIGAFHLGRDQKMFGPLNPRARKIFDKTLARFLGKNRAEMIRAHVHERRDGMKGNIRIGKMDIDIALCLLNHGAISARSFRLAQSHY